MLGPTFLMLSQAGGSLELEIKPNTHKLSPATALLLYFTSPFQNQWIELVLTYGHLKSHNSTNRTCPRVSSACVQQEGCRLVTLTLKEELL